MLAIITQIIVVAAVLGFFAFLYNNMVTSLRDQLGVAISFGFLDQVAGFDIGESLIEYGRSDTYARAFMVGLLNTLQVAFLGIILSTILGTIIGIMRLSNNWLVSKIALVYVETFRNIPLLLLLIFIAQAVFLKLPAFAKQSSCSTPFSQSILATVALPLLGASQRKTGRPL